LQECLHLYFQLHKDANSVTLYPNLRQSVAESDDAVGTMAQKGLAAMDELMRTASFIRQELLTMPEPALTKAFAAQPALAEYRNYIDNLRRRSNRILSPDAEHALSLLGDNLWAEIDLNEIPSSLEEAFSATRSDIPWPKVKDEKGQEVQFTLSGLTALRRSANRDVRRGAYEAYLATLRQYQHVFAAELGGQVKLDVAYARARGYDSSLAAYLDKDNVSTSVYDNLVSTVDANVSLLHRYVELRKKVLGLPDVHLYDLYVPLASEVAEDIPFSKARPTILEALKPLGPDYGKVLDEGLNPANGWLDLYPHKDKESGAFSASVYGPHPYVQINYLNSVDDMSTLAHEFGHALHSYLSMKHQPYPNFRYVTMLAEIASTCNESLLNDYLVAHTTDPAKKAYLLVERLESIRQTIFRQTMFAEFEREIHRLSESGTPLTASVLDKTYLDLIKKYYGPGFTTDPNDGMEWAGVPHFYYKYYVWSYATGLSSGIAIADRVREVGSPAVAGYLEMLQGGCSQPPIELLKKAGVDLTKPDAIEAAMRTFEKTLNEVEKLLVH
ncbi:MAG TPA: oligoendopeptidase F, partial [Acidobacteriota bacterium]|nr:oligoendopeptidase F [Acidobacteriota bacterium]